MEMLFSCPRCTGAHLASQNRNLGALPKMVDFLISPLIWKCYFPVPVHWCPFGVPKSEFGSLAENGRFLNKPLIWKCYFPVPAALVLPIWRPKSEFRSLAENGRFSYPLITIFAVLLVSSISTSPTENCCLVCCYQILLIKGPIYIRPRVDLGVDPHFDGSDGKKHGKSTVFLENC